MTSRRDLLIGLAAVGAAGAAYALTPRRNLSLLGQDKMARIVPRTVGPWSAADTDGLVTASTEGKLASTLYSELVGRNYRNVATGQDVMMLIAYGDTQSDLLQLHRPENCYPAVGFTLKSTEQTNLQLPGGGQLPVRHVVAHAGDRMENIIYWTRLGEYLPASAGEQRKDRLRNAMDGVIPDGVLMRFSMLGGDPKAAFAVMDPFISALVAAVEPAKRPALVGTRLARTVRA